MNRELIEEILQSIGLESIEHSRGEEERQVNGKENKWHDND